MTKEARDKIAGGLQEAAIIAPYLARIAELEKALDAFHKDPENPDAYVLRYKAIASKAINEQVELSEEYEARIAELEAAIERLLNALNPQIIHTPEEYDEAKRQAHAILWEIKYD